MTLRPPYVAQASPDDVQAAALQYVRKIAGMRSPSARNQQAFDAAVEAVAQATATLLSDLVVRRHRRARNPPTTGVHAGRPGSRAGCPSPA